MKQPNILFLMTDQMRADVLAPGSQCLTPNLDRLINRGIRFENAYTTNAICSPARAGIMTGLLPHNHGVFTVTHLTDEDQCNLRTDYPHWAQRLQTAGYRTGYFGKWHIERTNDLKQFGWETDCGSDNEAMRQRMREANQGKKQASYSLSKYYETAGYNSHIFYGVCDIPPEDRGMGLISAAAGEYLDKVLEGEDPWCCFVSVQEPHDPFVCGEEAFAQYDVDAIELPPNVHEDIAGRPGLYRKAAKVWEGMTDQEHREVRACYYASISEIDAQFGKLLDKLEETDALDNTIIVFTTDHGEHLGAHRVYCKNVGASEEVYNIPLVMSGPGMPGGVTTSARVGSHDLCPTLLELTGCQSVDYPDCRSFAPVLSEPLKEEKNFTQGFAEYFGGRYWLTQRITWDGPWKFVHNGFDFDELYNLEEDPFEMNNLAEGPAHDSRLKAMLKIMWERIKTTGDHSLHKTHYPVLRLAPYGPGIIEDEND